MLRTTSCVSVSRKRCTTKDYPLLELPPWEGGDEEALRAALRTVPRGGSEVVRRPLRNPSGRDSRDGPLTLRDFAEEIGVKEDGEGWPSACPPDGNKDALIGALCGAAAAGEDQRARVRETLARERRRQAAEQDADADGLAARFADADGPAKRHMRGLEPAASRREPEAEAEAKRLRLWAAAHPLDIFAGGEEDALDALLGRGFCVESWECVWKLRGVSRACYAAVRSDSTWRRLYEQLCAGKVHTPPAIKALLELGCETREQQTRRRPELRIGPHFEALMLGLREPRRQC